jgi:hypothetical protein
MCSGEKTKDQAIARAHVVAMVAAIRTGLNALRELESTRTPGTKGRRTGPAILATSFEREEFGTEGIEQHHPVGHNDSELNRMATFPALRWARERRVEWRYIAPVRRQRDAFAGFFIGGCESNVSTRQCSPRWPHARAVMLSRLAPPTPDRLLGEWAGSSPPLPRRAGHRRATRRKSADRQRCRAR